MTRFLTVLSWNVFVGAGAPVGPLDHLRKYRRVLFVDRRRLDCVARLATVIQRNQCDVVCLQEVDCGSWRNGRQDLLGELAASTGMPHKVFARQRRRHCNDGVALLSRHELHDCAVVALPYELERRVLLRATLLLDGEPVCVAVTHLAAFPFNAALRRRQARQIERALPSEMPTVLGGDFNCDIDARDLEPLWIRRRFRPALKAMTFPNYQPRFRFDNVLVTPECRVHYARVLDDCASDHLAVIARVEPRSGPSSPT